MYLRQLESGRWQCVVRRKGLRPRSKTFRTKAAAANWGRDVESALEAGPVAGTVAEMLDRYEREETVRKKGRRQESSRIGILKESLGHILAGALTVEDVLEFANTRLESLSSDTIRRDVHVLSAMLDHAQVVWSLPVENVARTALRRMVKAKTLKPPVRRIRRITREEEVKLYAELSFENACLVAFALETAMRRGELARMKWEHVKGDSLLIPDDKTGKSSVIPLSGNAKLIIMERQKATNDLVFSISPDAITRFFNRACKRAKISARFHDLRHEGISRLFEKGLGIQEVCVISRHSDYSSLKIYTHPDHDVIRGKLG